MASSPSYFNHRHFVLAVIAQFFYVGAQVGTWSYFISYVQEYSQSAGKSRGLFSDWALWACSASAVSSRPI